MAVWPSYDNRPENAQIPNGVPGPRGEARMSRWLVVAGPLAALVLYFVLQAQGWALPASITASVTLLCALWWIFEPIPIPITSLLPLAVFPLFGVLTPAQVGSRSAAR
jgi:sodium-dependent dicarboxylate transporter 2/3/5